MRLMILFFLSVAFIFTLFLHGFYLFPNNCDDVVYREFTDFEKEMFPYEVGDTAYFLNETDGQHYYFYCSESFIRENDTVTSPDYYCDNGGTTYIKSISFVRLSSNVNLKSGSDLDVKFYLATGEEYFSKFGIEFGSTVDQNIWLHVDLENGNLLPFEHINRYDTVQFYEKKIVNNRTYEDVYEISLKTDIPLPVSHEALTRKIDRLYYSRSYDILKLTAKKENLELSRL